MSVVLAKEADLQFVDIFILARGFPRLMKNREKIPVPDDDIPGHSPSKPSRVRRKNLSYIAHVVIEIPKSKLNADVQVPDERVAPESGKQTSKIVNKIEHQNNDSAVPEIEEENTRNEHGSCCVCDPWREGFSIKA